MIDIVFASQDWPVFKLCFSQALENFVLSQVSLYLKTFSIFNKFQTGFRSFQGPVLKWFTSYLSDRTFTLRIVSFIINPSIRNTIFNITAMQLTLYFTLLQLPVFWCVPFRSRKFTVGSNCRCQTLNENYGVGAHCSCVVSQFIQSMVVSQ